MAPFRIAKPRFLAYFAAELALIVAVVGGLAHVTVLLTPDLGGANLGVSVLAISCLFCVVLFGMQWSNLGDEGSLAREIVLFTFLSLILGLAAFSAIWVLFGRRLQLGAFLALEGMIAVPIAVAAWRLATARLSFLSNAVREQVLILGTGETARQVARWIVTHHGSEYAVIGFADADDSRFGTVLAMGARIQTGYETMPEFCHRRVDRVIVAVDEKRGQLPVRQLMELRLRGIEIEDSTSFFERISGRIAVETMLPSWLIFSEGFKSTRLRRVLKRIVDIGLSLALLVVTAPLVLFTALLIRLDSRGPVLYRQTRLGLNRREFSLLKLRSMHVDAELHSGPTWTRSDDPRITRVGWIIRKLRIDELPQLVNVLRGEMSFVGPRPERGHFVSRLEELIPYYGLRMTVRPGLTGWAQVEYGYGASEEEALEKLKYDLYYIKNANLLLDLWIVLKTFKVIAFGKGAR
jgi:sugar transferase (PEP-CTERM system associated)